MYTATLRNIVRGCDWRPDPIPWRLKGTGAKIALDGSKFELSFWPKGQRGQDSPALQLTTENGGVAVDTAASTTAFILTKEQIASSLTGKVYEHTFVWVLADGTRKPVWQGEAFISET